MFEARSLPHHSLSAMQPFCVYSTAAASLNSSMVRMSSSGPSERGWLKGYQVENDYETLAAQTYFDKLNRLNIMMFATSEYRNDSDNEQFGKR